MLTQEQMLTITTKEPARLDLVMASSGLSRRESRRLIDSLRVMVNDRFVSIASRIVTPADRILVIRNPMSLDIVAIEKDFVAIDKPAGIAALPAQNRLYPSCIDLLTIQLSESGEPSDLFPVHRIDAATSGLLLFARTSPSAARLSDLFASRDIRKRYLALVSGDLRGTQEIDAPIARLSADKFGVREDGKKAKSWFQPMGRRGEATLIDVNIETGRTHQIRVHAAHIGHPVLGDRKYGGPPADRLMLHAWKLEHRIIGSLEAKPPEVMQP